MKITYTRGKLAFVFTAIPVAVLRTNGVPKGLTALWRVDGVPKIFDFGVKAGGE